MRLQMRAVDHQPFQQSGRRRELGEDVGEHAEAAPADKPVVERLVRAIAAWRIFPLQTMADHVDDPADHPAVVHPGKPARARKKGSIGVTSPLVQNCTLSRLHLRKGLAGADYNLTLVVTQPKVVDTAA